MSLIFKVHHLSSSDPDLQFLAGKFASLRLQALNISPAAFGSTFEQESVFTPSDWVSSLTRSNVHNFIAVSYPSSLPSEQQTIARGDFAGSITMLGPTSKDKYEWPLSGGSEIGSDDQETKWHMTGLYNSPDHRRKGLAKMIITAAVEFATKEGGKRSRVRLAISPYNTMIKNLYLGLGFLDAGRCTFVEAFIANGAEHLLPPDRGQSDPEKYFSRTGIVMEKITEFTRGQ